MKTVIVTDSACDLPPHVIHEMGIHVVPLHLVIGDDTYRDGLDLSREAFYEQLPALRNLPKTSAPASGVFEALYRRLLQEADAIVSVHVASTLSATYSAACVGANAVDGAENITVVDSGQVSMGLGWAVLDAAQAGRDGERPEGVRQRVMDVLRRVRVIAIFNTMEFLRRGGRVSWLRANAGEAMRVKPIVELREGEVVSRGRVRRWPNAVAQLASHLRNLGAVSKLAMLHTNCRQCVSELQAHVGDMQASEPPLIVDVTPVIGTHVGPHALGVAVVLDKENPDTG